MEDEGHWFTQMQVDQFYEIIVKNSGVADLARKVGQYMPLAESAGAISQYTLGFVTPATAYVMLGKLYPRISRSVNVEAGKISVHQSQVIITQNPGVKEKPYQCENRIGVFEGVAKLFTNKLARVDHPICMHTSGDRCVYHIHWEEASSNTWKRIVRYGSLLAAITSIILFIFLPVPYSAVAILSLLSFVVGAYCYQIFLEKNELKISLKNHGDMANDLLDEIDTRYNNAMMVQEIGQASSHILNVDKLLQLTLEVIKKRLAFDRGLIMLADQNRTHLTYQAGFGYREEEEISLRHMSFLLDAPDPNEPFITSFLQQTPFLVKDGQEIEKIIATGNRTYAKQMRVKSFLCVPIVYEGKAEGIIAMDNHRSSTQMKQSDVSLLSGIAHQIGISIHNAKTYRLVLESKELYTKLVDTLPDVIVRTDLEGKILFINDYAFQINGYRRDELEGQNILQYIAPEQQSAALQNIALMMEGKIVPHEYHLLTKDGRKVPFEINGNVLRNEDGTPFGVVVVGRNISERKKTEDVIKKSEEQYRRITENMSDLVSEVDAQSIFTYVSPSHLRIVGYAQEELLGRFAYENIHPEDLEKIIIEGGQGVRSGEEREVEYRYRHKNGHYIWLRSIGHSLRNAEGDHTGAVMSSNDITERKQAELEWEKLQEQLIQVQKMESVGRLAGGVAHDFNNMLSVIIGNTELAMNRVTPSDPIHKSLQEILNAGNRSADLTRQLLAFARKQTVSPKVLELNDTVTGMLKMLQRLIGEDIKLTWNPGTKLWRVRIDPSQVDQLLANLAVNARDAIEKTGRIVIETSNAKCNAAYCIDRPEWIPGDYVVLAVSDDGCGMEKETITNIFEPFFTTKKEGQGTGLGLATVYGIVKQNNGFINVYSEPGQGTTFKIFLPRYMDEIVETADEESEPELPGGTETILVVEDSVTVLKLCKAMLETLGYQVLAANGKDEALKLAGEYSVKIDLLLTDVVMPDMNGKELSERIVAINPGLKCLYMSGYTADVIARQGVLDEGIKFISKPFSLRDLAEKVREVIGS